VIYFGTSGYSYDDWQERYYPADLARGDRLGFYAAEFGAVELNFSYYRMPEAEHLAEMVSRTPASFRFSIKAHQDITHGRKDAPGALARFRAALVPLQKAQKLGAVLFQFPYSFHNTVENTAYLRDCAEQLPDLPLVVEFRNNEWLTQRTVGLLRELGVAFCNVDMPQLPGLLPKTAWVTAPIAYVRLHGRNAEKWWRHEHAWQRYDYSYSEEELAEWVPHLLDMERQSQALFVFANNHWQGQSVQTVRQLAVLLEQQSG